MPIIRTATYRADLEQIVDTIANDRPKAALAIWDEIESQIEQLAQYPYLGRVGRVADTRELVVNRTPFVVGYRVTDDAVIILRVLHGARQWPTTIDEPPSKP